VIVLFGATGFTGRRTAEAMVRRGLRPVLAGRDVGRLNSLARRLGNVEPEHERPGKLDVVCADAGDAASVRALIGRGDVLVSTVGPFIRLGAPALSAAVDAGAIYLDSTGEPPFIRRVFEEFAPLAEQTGASLITAFGYDYVPGNLAGALALQRSDGGVHRVEVGYLSGGGGRAQVISRGTFVSIVGLITEQSYTWRDGIQPEPTASRIRTFPLGGRNRLALTIGATEHYSLPRLAGPEGLSEVDVYLGAFGPAVRALHLCSRVAPTLLALPGVRSVVRTIGEFAAHRIAEEPDPAALARVTSHVVGTAYDAAGTALAEVRLVSGDPYQLTADLLAWSAQRADEHGVSAPGALGPVEAFGLEALETGARQAGLHRL
jgi:short subunit dehydrogenase-like uncharacterized protein